MIDEKLNYSEHISSLCNKAARQLNALSCISKCIDEPSRKVIYNSFISSNFTYCFTVWHFCGKANNGKLKKMNERVYGFCLMSIHHRIKTARLLKFWHRSFGTLKKSYPRCFQIYIETHHISMKCLKSRLFSMKHVNPYSLYNLCTRRQYVV